jgi:hypothetical protein
MGPYTVRELTSFLPSGTDAILAFEVVKVPGQALTLKSAESLSQMLHYAELLVDKISVANFANALTIVKKFIDKDTDTSFEPDIFLNCVAKVLKDRYITFHKDYLLKLYHLTIEVQKKLRYRKVAVPDLIGNYITQVWKEVN